MLISCGTGDTRKLTTEEIVYNPKDKSRLGQMKDGGSFLSGMLGADKDTEGSSVGIVSIKSPLWKASLEILSSFPLSNVDSRSGLIITDWYTSEKKPSERFKITVLLLSNNIRAVFMAGRDGPAYKDTMDYVTIASTGDAADFGDLTEAHSTAGNASDNHGGLQSS